MDELDGLSDMHRHRGSRSNIDASSTHNNRKLVSDFESALNLLKDARPGVLSPDEAVTEHLVVRH